MKKLHRRPSVWIAGAVVLAVAIASSVLARGSKVQTALATRRDIEQHVVASGRVMPPARVNIATNVGGLVVVVGAVEGQHIKRGDLLVQIDDAQERAQVAQAKASVEQANAKVEQLRRVGAIVASQGLNQAQANLEKAQMDFERTKALVASGSLPQAQLEDAKRALDVSRAQKNAAEAQQVGSTPMGADSRVALSSLLQAQAQLTGAEVRLAQTKVLALHDGTVLTRSVEQGDTVQPGRTLMTVATDGDIELVFEPDERNLATIALHQSAKASADAFPGDVFEAEVSYIAPSVDPARGTVEVRLRVPTPPPYLKPDMTMSIDLTVATKKQALVVPSDAVHALATPAPWVLAAEDGRVARKNVKLGITGDGSLEIADGLAESAEVILPDGQNLRVGQRVRTSHVER